MVRKHKIVVEEDSSVVPQKSWYWVSCTMHFCSKGYNIDMLNVYAEQF